MHPWQLNSCASFVSDLDLRFKALIEKHFQKGISPHITTGFDVIMLDKN